MKRSRRGRTGREQVKDSPLTYTAAKSGSNSSSTEKPNRRSRKAAAVIDGRKQCRTRRNVGTFLGSVAEETVVCGLFRAVGGNQDLYNFEEFFWVKQRESRRTVSFWIEAA